MASISRKMMGLGAVILFTLSMFLFMTSYLSANNPDSLINENPLVNSTSTQLQTQVDAINQLSTDVSDQLSADVPSVVYVFLIISSAFYIPKAIFLIMVTIIITPFTFIFTVLSGQAGLTPLGYAITLIFSLTIIGIVLSVISAIRGGQSG
jgi:hypothetical protein